VKLPVSYWTAAEAADCFFGFCFYIRFEISSVTMRFYAFHRKLPRFILFARRYLRLCSRLRCGRLLLRVVDLIKHPEKL
jgi:hypothetical protein